MVNAEKGSMSNEQVINEVVENLKSESTLVDGLGKPEIQEVAERLGERVYTRWYSGDDSTHAYTFDQLKEDYLNVLYNDLDYMYGDDEDLEFQIGNLYSFEEWISDFDVYKPKNKED